ncbi:hypothetical protein ES332_A13G161700v1 [Gossypium tomentosum]|uniref:Uncharacterized protein n=1 Tax=Gossypium tomentosum TaxID=34277 RepID=A0A5D2MLW2_GOSTO|nr:hypothetical protein ES332_A13G161700v1 [Gossypium tomentosum]
MIDPGTAATVLVAPPEAQVQVPKRRNKRLKPLPEYINKYIVSERPRPDGRIDKKYRHKERNITLRSLLEVKRYETDGILPVRGKKKKESNKQSESLAPLLPSTMERINSENMHVSNLIASTSTAPKGRRGRKRKMKTVVTAPIDIPINDEATLIDVPINDEDAPVDGPIINEAGLIDVPITYVENFGDLGR